MQKPVLITCVLLILVSLFVFSCGFLALGLWWIQTYRAELETLTQTPVAWKTLPGFTQPAAPLPTASLPPTPILPSDPPDAAQETLLTLTNIVVPISDPVDLAQRLEGKTNLPRALDAPVEVFQVGAKKAFYVTNSDSNQYSLTPATLRYMTDHVYFWVADGVTYRQRDLERLADTFEQEIYPTNREFFGSEWTPGVDADPRLFILYTRGLGNAVAGYFSSADEYLPMVRPDSNGHEIFIISADHLDLGEGYTYGVLAHEFQHMIHWYTDRNEETWVNEGLSELAVLLNGYRTGQGSTFYALDPDIQLTDWPTESNARSAHYGASFLFFTYFLDRFGEKATQAVVAEPKNGMFGIEKVLQQLAVFDPLRQRIYTADDVFSDWALANFLQDRQLGGGSVASDGRYGYENYPQAPRIRETESISTCPQNLQTREVSQYGVDLVSIRCQGEYTLRFAGLPVVNVLPEGPYSGNYAFYSNRGDESDMTLTRSFDFRGQNGPLTLQYYTWYDLEADYDYAYLLASEDGVTWQILTTPSGTAEDPSGNSYGWGYNGLSGGWIQEQVDLAAYAGKVVQLRFEYITDAAVNGEGLWLDDIAIPEIGYFTDFENGEDGWQADGFVRIQNVLPQTYRLSLVVRGGKNGKQVSVQYLDLPASNILELPLSFGPDAQEVILVISGTARFTRQKALYQFSVLPR